MITCRSSFAPWSWSGMINRVGLIGFLLTELSKLSCDLRPLGKSTDRASISTQPFPLSSGQFIPSPRTSTSVIHASKCKKNSIDGCSHGHDFDCKRPGWMTPWSLAFLMAQQKQQFYKRQKESERRLGGIFSFLCQLFGPFNREAP